MTTIDPQNSNNPIEQPIADDFLVIQKQSPRMFIVTELMIYFSQIMMFFFAAALTSNLLRDEKQLVSYMASKINADTIHDTLATMLAIAATVGVIASITKALSNSSWLERIADEVLNEAPRTAYFFGSSGAGTMLAAALFIHYHPQEGITSMRWLLMALLYATAGFMYGCMFAYAFKHKTHIKKTDGVSS
jgi:hypothetical protein